MPSTVTNPYSLNVGISGAIAERRDPDVPMMRILA